MCITNDTDITAPSDSVTLYPLARLFIVPENTSVSFTCKVHYSGHYSVQLYRDNTSLNRTFFQEGYSTHNFTLSVTSAYKNTQITCIISPHERNRGTIESNTVILNAVAEGKLLIVL